MSDPKAGKSTPGQFTLARDFNASRHVVWRAWTDRGLLGRWFGPKGATTEVVSFDLRPGGVAHLSMDISTGQRLWAKFVYREILEPSRLVWVHSFSDENANIVPSPFGGPWPLEILTTILFDGEGKRTRICLTWEPIGAKQEERDAFQAAFGSMEMGWNGSFDRLADTLVTLE
jgi:uncharacterized protein YndB with AHSA1/START domain